MPKKSEKTATPKKRRIKRRRIVRMTGSLESAITKLQKLATPQVKFTARERKLIAQTVGL